MSFKDTILSIMGKKKQNQAEAEIRSIVILFNKVNHASLIAATLAERLCNERIGGNVSVMMADIRDGFSDDADRYIWLDCGTPDQYTSYYVPGGKFPVGQEAELKAWFEELKAKSVVLSPIVRQDRQIEETVLGLVYLYLYEADIASEMDRPLFMRYAMLSEQFLSGDNRMEEHDVTAYSTALLWAYNNYNGMPITLKTMEALLTPSEGQVSNFIEKQPLINKAMTNRYKAVQIGNRMVYQFSSTGPEIYGLLRRAALAKKEFLHVSMGSFGSVLYSSVPMPEPAKSNYGGVLDLTPSIELMATAVTWKVELNAA